MQKPVASDIRSSIVDMSFCLLRELPRPNRHVDGDPSWAQRLAALTSAYLEGGPIAVGWRREASGSPVDILVGGEALIGRGADGAPEEPEVAVNLPPGSRGVSLNGETAWKCLESFSSWVRIRGIPDALSIGERRGLEPDRSARPSLEDAIAGVWRDPFAWLALANPIPLKEVEHQSAELSRLIPPLRAKASNSQEHAVNLERHEERYRELQRAELSGLWEVHVLAGAASAEHAARFAALLCTCFDLDGLPYMLKPADGATTLSDLIGTPVDDGSGGASPFSASTNLLAAIASPPRVEVPGVRMRRLPTFDLTPETQGDIPLGTVMDASLTDAGPMTLSREALNRHTFVCGATGSGKSQTIRGLLEQLARSPGGAVPWLAIEPAKAEYRRMSGRLEGHSKVTVIRPGTPAAVPAGLNPLEPELGFPLQTHVDLTRALFLASFQSEEPFPQVLNAALTRCYEELGWDLVLGEARTEGVTPRYPTLGDLQRVARDVVSDIGYAEEIARNVRGFVDIRLSSLRHGTPGRFFEGGHPLDVGALLKENAVLEIEDLGDDQDKAFLMGTVIIRLVEHLRVQANEALSGQGQLRHVTVIEEAHRLLRRTEEGGPAAHAVELFASLLAEVRAYGEGIIVAEQIPSKVIPDVIKNTAVKVVHRLPAKDDRETVGATMNLTDAHSEYIVTVTPGAAAAFVDGMDYPALIRVDLGEERENDRSISFDAPLAGRYSAACGAECRKEGGACTLRRMRQAQRLLEEDGRIVLWAELVVLAHVLGLRSPAPGKALKMDLGALERRTLDCALAHALEAAVAVRSEAVSRHYSPAALARHAAEVLQNQLAGKRPPCFEDDHWAWQAGPFRWSHILTKLRERREAGETTAHPETEMWASLYGVRLDAPSCDGQIAMLDELRAGQAEYRRALLYGHRCPSSIELGLGSEPGADGWLAAVEAGDAALAFDEDWRWTKYYLTPERGAAS